MALEDILRALEEKAQTTVETITEEAEQEVSRIKAEAEAEAARTKRLRLKKIEDSLRSEITAMIYSASLRAKREVNQAQEEAVERVFEEAEKRLGEIARSDSYGDIFKALLDECLEMIDGEIMFDVREEDREMLERLLKGKGVPYSISSTPLQAAGGLNAMTPDRSITVFNTFEKRLERARRRLRLTISNILFAD